MKKSLFLLVMILVLPLFLQSPTHAALTPYYSESGNSIVNYANLYYPNLYFGAIGAPNIVGANNPVENSHSYFDNFETYLGQSTGHSGVNFRGSANADSGISNGVLYSTAYASMTYEGFTGNSTDTPGVDASQQITAKYTQYYYDPDGGTMQINGSLDLGEINFDDVIPDVFSEYSITGSVIVNESTFSLSGSTVANATLASLDLSSDNLSDSDIVIIQPGTLGVPGDYFYSVTTSLTITASLDNHEWNGVVTADAFSGNQFIIGDSDNPIMVTASWSEPIATPVPSSLLLLISGVAGISFIRRRRS